MVWLPIFRYFCSFFGLKMTKVRGQAVFLRFIECFFFFLIKRVPFNWRTPFGYLLYVVFFFVGGFCISISATTTISFATGSFLLFISFVEDATNDLVRLNVDKKSKSHGFEVKTRFHSAVHDYSDLKELKAHSFL